MFMFDPIKIIILVALARILIEYRKPLLCALIYAGIIIAVQAVFIHAFSPLDMILTVISFCLFYVYYRLLNKYYDISLRTFFIILFAGMMIGLI